MKELGNVFFSKEQLEVSIKRLGELDPFFGTVFLCAFQMRQEMSEKYQR